MGGELAPTEQASLVLERMGIDDAPASHLDAVAKVHGIRVKRVALPDDPTLSGMLLFRGDKRAILINTFVNHAGRINFTFAHELGHYFLKHAPSYTLSGQVGFRCTPDDMNVGRDQKEVEANQFASSFLMPEFLFRPSIAGSMLDYALIDNLARYFRVSKHACCNRILEFVREPYIVVRSNGYAVTEIRASRAARGHLFRLRQIPVGTAAYEAISKKRNQSGFVECDPSKWLAKVNPAIRLYEWTHGEFGNGVAMTILRW